jgi:hypothetical protein
MACVVPGHGEQPGCVGCAALRGAVEEGVPPGHQPLQGARDGHHGEADPSPLHYGQWHLATL